jgi:hypothetical protein
MGGLCLAMALIGGQMATMVITIFGNANHRCAGLEGANKPTFLKEGRGLGWNQRSQVYSEEEESTMRATASPFRQVSDRGTALTLEISLGKPLWEAAF